MLDNQILAGQMDVFIVYICVSFAKLRKKQLFVFHVKVFYIILSYKETLCLQMGFSLIQIIAPPKKLWSLF